jgi:hypothetical protein
MKMGGPIAVVSVVKALGRQHGPPVYWMGSWIEESGYGGYDVFLDRCAGEGFVPAIQIWEFGDQIGEGAIENGVTGYGGELKTKAKALELARQCALRAKARGLKPYFIVETEWNKGGISGWSGWSDYYLSVAKVLRDNCPGCRIVCAPGNWGNLTDLARFHLRAFEGSDVLATQGLFSVVRGMSIDVVRNPAPLFEAAIKAMRAAAASLAAKTALITDFGVSTYGGNFAATHPFGGGDGTALEGDQETAFRNAAMYLGKMEAAGIEALLYRALVDDPNTGTYNYYGFAERSFGILHSNGTTKKRGYDEFFALAGLPTLNMSMAARMHAPAYEIGNGVACGTVTLFATQDVVLPKVVLAARPPGASRTGGPYLDIGSVVSVALKANVPKEIRLARPLTDGDPLGDWTAYVAVRLPNGTWRDEPTDHPFRVLPRCA